MSCSGCSLVSRIFSLPALGLNQTWKKFSPVNENYLNYSCFCFEYVASLLTANGCTSILPAKECYDVSSWRMNFCGISPAVYHLDDQGVTRWQEVICRTVFIFSLWRCLFDWVRTGRIHETGSYLAAPLSWYNYHFWSRMDFPVHNTVVSIFLNNVNFTWFLMLELDPVQLFHWVIVMLWLTSFASWCSLYIIRYLTHLILTHLNEPFIHSIHCQLTHALIALILWIPVHILIK